MDVLTAIKTRHSVGRVKPDPIPEAIINTLLSAAVQAPNHFKVRPWQFVVLTGGSREKFGEFLAKNLARNYSDSTQELLEKARLKPLRAPLVIVLATARPEDPRVDDIENVCATAAAGQNILLAAHSLGLGAIWRTGNDARDPEVKNFFGFHPDQHLLGFLYIGYPEMTEFHYPERPSFEDRTTWMG